MYIIHPFHVWCRLKRCEDVPRFDLTSSHVAFGGSVNEGLQFVLYFFIVELFQEGKHWKPEKNTVRSLLPSLNIWY